MSWSRLFLVITVWSFAWFSTIAVGEAQEQRIGRSPGMVAAERRIRAELDDVTTLEFIETPLRDVVEFLKDVHEIPIEISVNALGDGGLSTDVPVTRHVKGITLRSALRMILEDMDLTYVVAGDVLLITTKVDAETRPASRVYVVGNLVPFGGDGPQPFAEVLRSTLSPDEENPTGPTITSYGPLIILRGTEEELDDAETLLWRIQAALHGEAAQAMPPARPARAPPPPGAADPFGGSGADPFGGPAPK